MAKIPDEYVDKRTRARNIRKGLISQKDFDQHLEELPDQEGNAQTIEIGDAARDR